MDRRDIKKLLIDLDLSTAEVARSMGLSHTAVRKYFAGELKGLERRQAIQRMLSRRGRKLGVAVPRIWPSQS